MVWLNDLGFPKRFEANVTAHRRLYGLHFEKIAVPKNFEIRESIAPMLMSSTPIHISASA